MSREWRLILDGPVDAATNMARDRAVQLEREAGSSPSTLRLYRWTRPTVSIGRFQALDSIDVAYCRDNGIDVVRRFTGGRGVLHSHEVTYSVVASVADGIPRGVAASYRYLCSALVASFEQMGLAASVTEHDKTRSASSACYLSTTRADVTAGLAKLAGSAQVWAGSTVLQHGSFVISRDLSVESRIFRLGEAETSELSSGAVSIAESLGSVLPERDVKRAIVDGFSRALGITLVEGPLTESERRAEKDLLAQTDPASRHVRPPR